MILLENVWASFLIEPLSMARYIDELDSPMVGSYFDVGNVVRWGWPQHWIEVLGKRVKKLDIKEYDLKVAMNEGLRKGFDKPLGGAASIGRKFASSSRRSTTKAGPRPKSAAAIERDCPISPAT